MSIFRFRLLGFGASAGLQILQIEDDGPYFNFAFDKHRNFSDIIGKPYGDLPLAHEEPLVGLDLDRVELPGRRFYLFPSKDLDLDEHALFAVEGFKLYGLADGEIIPRPQ